MAQINWDDPKTLELISKTINEYFEKHPELLKENKENIGYDKLGQPMSVIPEKKPNLKNMLAEEAKDPYTKALLKYEQPKTYIPTSNLQSNELKNDIYKAGATKDVVIGSQTQPFFEPLKWAVKGGMDIKKPEQISNLGEYVGKGFEKAQQEYKEVWNAIITAETIPISFAAGAAFSVLPKAVQAGISLGTTILYGWQKGQEIGQVIRGEKSLTTFGMQTASEVANMIAFGAGYKFGRAIFNQPQYEIIYEKGLKKEFEIKTKTLAESEEAYAFKTEKTKVLDFPEEIKAGKLTIYRPKEFAKEFNLPYFEHYEFKPEEHKLLISKYFPEKQVFQEITIKETGYEEFGKWIKATKIEPEKFKYIELSKTIPFTQEAKLETKPFEPSKSITITKSESPKAQTQEIQKMIEVPKTLAKQIFSTTETKPITNTKEPTLLIPTTLKITEIKQKELPKTIIESKPELKVAEKEMYEQRQLPIKYFKFVDVTKELNKNINKPEIKESEKLTNELKKGLKNIVDVSNVPKIENPTIPKTFTSPKVPKIIEKEVPKITTQKPNVKIFTDIQTKNFEIKVKPLIKDINIKALYQYKPSVYALHYKLKIPNPNKIMKTIFRPI